MSKLHPVVTMSIFLALLFFSLTIFVEASGNTEREPNNSYSTATTINCNTEYTGSLSARYSSETDWYSFTITQPGYVELILNTEKQENNNTYWDISIRDKDNPDKDLWQEYVKGYETSTRSCKIGLEPGTYYFEIESANSWSNSIYSFVIEYHSSDFWEQEKNDKWSTANSIQLNCEYSGSLRMAYQSEQDWYAFTVTKPGYITLILNTEKQENNDTYWDVSIRDSDNPDKDLWQAYINGYEDQTNSCKIGLEPGTYYFEIESADNWSSDIYVFTIEYYESEYWELESNETWKSATQIKTMTEYYGSLRFPYQNEKDWFCFTLESARKVQLLLSTAQIDDSSTYWDISIRDKDNPDKELWRAKSSGNITTTQSGWLDLSAGTYYVEIESANRHSSETYTIFIDEYHECNGKWVMVREPTCIEEGQKGEVCIICGKRLKTEKISAYGHISENWTVVKEPTCTETGYRCANCDRCHKDVQEVIEMLSHAYGEWNVVSGNKVVPPIVKEQICSQCGHINSVKDWSCIWITILTGVAVVGALIGIINYIRAFKRR